MLSKLQTLKEEREQGFTLIELLVVILIIGILSAIAIPAFMNQRKSAVDSSVQSDVSNAAKQVETLAVKAGASGGSVTISGAAGGNHTIIVTPTNGSAASTMVMDTSDGTSLRVNGNTGTGYFIQGTNPGGDVAAKAPVAAPSATAGTGYIYDSISGGLKSK